MTEVLAQANEENSFNAYIYNLQNDYSEIWSLSRDNQKATKNTSVTDLIDSDNEYKTTSNITNTRSISDDDKIDDNDDDSKLPPQMQSSNPQVLL